jgi:hypothetical protein
MTVFLSSTCYDLPDLRAELEQFLQEKGHGILLSDRETFPVNPGVHRHDVCIDNVKLCDLFILIINKRYGAPYHRDKSVSITHAEFRQAIASKKQVIVYVRRNVFDERMSFQKNHTADKPYNPVYVDKNEVFTFIDEIQKDETGIWLQQFDNSVQVKQSLLKVFDVLAATKKDKPAEVKVADLSRETQEYISKRYTAKTKDKVTNSLIESILKHIPENMVPFGELLGHESIPSGDKYVSFVPIRWTGDEGEVLVGMVATPLGQAIRKEIETLKASTAHNKGG